MLVGRSAYGHSSLARLDPAGASALGRRHCLLTGPLGYLRRGEGCTVGYCTVSVSGARRLEPTGGNHDQLHPGRGVCRRFVPVHPCRVAPSGPAAGVAGSYRRGSLGEVRPLEVVNGHPLDAAFIAEEVLEIREQVVPTSSAGFSTPRRGPPRPSLRWLWPVAAYRVSPITGGSREPRAPPSIVRARRGHLRCRCSGRGFGRVRSGDLR